MERLYPALSIAAILFFCPSVKADEAPHPGEEPYRKVCAVCHSKGTLLPASRGAPKLGDPIAWEQRAPRGLDRLFDSVLTTPHGRDADDRLKVIWRQDLTDPQVRAAIDYMLEQLR